MYKKKNLGFTSIFNTFPHTPHFHPFLPPGVVPPSYARGRQSTAQISAGTKSSTFQNRDKIKNKGNLGH